MSKESEQYLGYLDKEMTIMGILSAFCVAVPSLILERLASAEQGELADVWHRGECYFWFASGLMLCAAALFYKQRSLLAFYYGRIALGKPQDGYSAPELKGWEDWADSWTTWIPYNAGFWVGVAATVEYLLGLASFRCSSVQQHACCCSCVVLLLLVGLLGVMVVVHKDRPIRLKDNPWIDGLGKIRRKWRQ